MGNQEQSETERILAMMEKELAGSADRPKAIHEAGHTVAALRLGLPLECVDIEDREEADGDKFGSTKVRSLGESFSQPEIEEHAPVVVECVRNHIIWLHAAAAATMLLRERDHDPLAQSDES